MTFEHLKEIEQQVINAVSSIFDRIKEVDFQSFILLLARGDYFDVYEREDIALSPYVIEDERDIYVDSSRQRFFVKYLNDYIEKLHNGRVNEISSIEYDMHIQMMIYTHIWESHLFLKRLLRIANILSNNGYKWKVEIPLTGKGKLIKTIINKLIDLYPILGTMLQASYSNDLRNDFAHSSYYIDLDRGQIYSHFGGLFKELKSIEEWEHMFITSIMLSYHLNDVLNKIKYSFPIQYGFGPFEIPISTKKSPQKQRIVNIIIDKELYFMKDCVRFLFLQ